MISNQFIVRPTKTFHVLDEIPENFDVAFLMLNVHGWTLDIGSLVFRRRTLEKKIRHTAKPVDLKSREESRTEFFTKVISLAQAKILNSEWTEYTFRSILSHLKSFFDWLDSEEICEAMATSENRIAAIASYVEFKRAVVRRNENKAHTAKIQINSVSQLIDQIFEGESVLSHLRMPEDNRNFAGTEPPRESDMGKLLSLCSMHFTGISNFVLNFSPYPYLLEMPSYLGWQKNSLWINPGLPSYQAPHTIEIQGEAPKCFNRSEGRICTHEERRSRSPGIKSHDAHIRRELRHYSELLAASNKDPRHLHRLREAYSAMCSFLVMFAAVTGAPFQVIEKLEWSDSYLTKAEIQGFKQIKFRAQNKEVSYPITTVFLVHFEKYLKLREFVLGTRTCKFLFFSFGTDGCAGDPKPVRWMHYHGHMRSLRMRIDPNLPWLLNRKLKSAKSDWLVRNADISTTALVLQNTEQTVKKHYAAGSATQALSEMGSYFRNQTKVIKWARETIDGQHASPIGNCSNHQAPERSHDKDFGPEPNCQDAEGCLSCGRYYLHADEIDVRKLFSYQYVSRMAAHLSSDVAFTDSFSQVNTRIAELVQRIEKRSEKHRLMVIRVREEVFTEGLISAYWQHKTEMLIELGLL